mgnify:CR=1 FL=1
MDDYQPNSDNAHNHTYPQQTEGLRRFDIHTGPERMHTWCTALERRIEALEANAAEQARLIEELRRACSNLAIRVAVLESQQTAIHVALQGGITPNDK